MTDHFSSNYGMSKLLFHFSDACIGHLNKMQTKIVVMLKVDISEGYCKIETMLKV